MNIRSMVLAVAVAVGALGSTSARADALGDDMRRASVLHRAGNTPAAMEIWRARAAQGSADAAYNLGLIHYYADGVPGDFAQALKWYRLAAEHGDRMSQFQIGLMYQNGEGVKADEAEAHHWFVMHRAEHHHHAHSAQMQRWREQAAALIQERDLREALAANTRDDDRVLAELRQRAGLPAMPALARGGASRPSN